MYKKLLKICIYAIIGFFIFAQTSVCLAADNHDVYHQIKAEKEKTSDWISDAFQAVKSFFNEDVKDDLGIVATPLDFFRSVIKGINRILLVLLAAISSISLAIVGIRYLMSTNSAEQQKKAVKDLHTTFKGMAFGFGAFFIWRIAMGIVEVIISNL